MCSSFLELTINIFLLQWKDKPKQLVGALSQFHMQVLPDYTILHDKNVSAPVLFADEVMKDLAIKVANSQSIIKLVFTRFIRMTKEQRKFNVVLA